MREIFYPNLEKYKSRVGGILVNCATVLSVDLSEYENAEKVFLVLTKTFEDAVYYEMQRKDYNKFEYSLCVTTTGLYYYHFLAIIDGQERHIGSKYDLYAGFDIKDEWQLTVYNPKYQVVDWLQGGIMYQIMPDRFNVGGNRLKTKHDVIYRDDWNGTPYFLPDQNGRILNNDFFGGNLQGIIQKIDYLKSLNVTCLYLNPIFEAHSNHKYDTGNYRRVDSDFGNINDLQELIDKCSSVGIKILLDGVFSHTGDDSIYFNRYGKYDSIGAYQSKDSPYYEWYNFTDFPNKYDSWWGIDILPNVNETNKHYMEFITGIDGVIEMWTKMGIGGFRLDVVDELPDEFLDKLTKAVKRANPNAMVLGEVWEDASNKVAYSVTRRYLLGKQLDSVMNYPFKEGIINYIRSGNSKVLNVTISRIVNNYPPHILNSLMNLLSTHDTKRLLTVFGEHNDVDTREKRAVAKLKNLKESVKMVKMATILQYTLPGVPCIYYGDEIGMQGFEDPFNRRPMDWDNVNKELLVWYKKLGKIRTDNLAHLKDSIFKCVFDENGVFAFKRGQLMVIVNNSDSIYAHDCRENKYLDLICEVEFNGIVDSRCGVILARIS